MAYQALILPIKEVITSPHGWKVTYMPRRHSREKFRAIRIGDSKQFWAETLEELCHKCEAWDDFKQ